MIRWFSNTDFSEESDEQLLERFRTRKNKAVFEALFKRYIELVYGSCLSLLKNQELAQDTAMEIFEKLYEDLQKHKVSYFRSWLYTYTRNFCLGKLRQSQKQRKDSNILFMQSQVFEHPNVEDEILNLDPSPLLNTCIETLKQQQKEVIIQFYFEKSSYKIIAKQLAISYNDVRSNLQNARRMLKKCLENSGVNKETYRN